MELSAIQLVIDICRETGVPCHIGECLLLDGESESDNDSWDMKKSESDDKSHTWKCNFCSSFIRCICSTDDQSCKGWRPPSDCGDLPSLSQVFCDNEFVHVMNITNLQFGSRGGSSSCHAVQVLSSNKGQVTGNFSWWRKGKNMKMKVKVSCCINVGHTTGKQKVYFSFLTGATRRSYGKQWRWVSLICW